MSNIAISLISPTNTTINDATPDLMAQFDAPYVDDLTLGTLTGVEYVSSALQLTGTPGADGSLDVTWGVNNSSHPGDAAAMDTLFGALTGVQYATINDKIGWGINAQNSKPAYLPADRYGWMAQGYLYIPVAGTYDFAIDSDDCSDLYVDSTFVVGRYNTNGMGVSNNWNSHAAVSLSVGWHAIRIRMEEVSGGDGLGLAWKKPGDSAFTLIDPVYFSTETPVYDASGNRVNVIATEGTASDVTIKWTEVTPTGASVVVKAVINTDGDNPPADGDYSVMTNGQLLVADGTNLAGKYLWIKILLVTTNTGITPSVSGMLINLPNDIKGIVTFEIDMTTAFNSPFYQTQNVANVSKKTDAVWTPSELLGSDRNWFWRVTVYVGDLHETEVSAAETFNCETGIKKRFLYEISNVAKLDAWTKKRFLYEFSNVSKLDVFTNKRQYYQYSNVTADPPFPWIENLSSNRGATGSLLTIYGNGFGAKAESDINNVDRPARGYGGMVFIGEMQCGVLSWSWTEIQIQIPMEAVTGAIKVVLTSPAPDRNSNFKGFEVYEAPVCNDVGLEMFLCSKDNPNVPMWQLGNIKGAAFQKLLDNPGSGKFSISRSDVIGGMRDRLTDQSFVLCRLDGVDVFKWIIESREPNYVDTDEHQMIHVCGRGVLAMLSWAVVYPFNLSNPVLEVAFNAPAGKILKYLMEKAQSRGCFQGVSITWTDDADSAGNPFTDTTEISFHVGTSLLDVASKFTGMGLFNIEMTPNLQLKIYNSKGQDMYQIVRYRPGQAIMTHVNKSDATSIVNSVLVEGAEGELAFADHPTSQEDWGRREGYLSASNISSGISEYGQKFMGRRAYSQWGIQGSVTKLTYEDGTRLKPFESYEVGDWIGWIIPPEGTDTVGFDGKLRVKGITCEENDENGHLNYTLELNNIMVENEIKLAQAIARLSQNNSVASDPMTQVVNPANSAPSIHTHEHGQLTQLDADDHEQYLNADRHAADLHSFISRVSGMKKSGADLMDGDITLAAGSNVSLYQNNEAQTITISAIGGGGAGAQDRIWIPPGVDLGYDDEFDDGSIAAAWIPVDVAGCPNSWYEVENNHGISCYAPNGKGSMKVAGLLKPFTGLSPPFFIETALRLWSRSQNYPAAGLIFSDGVAVGAGIQVIGQYLTDNNYLQFSKWTGFNNRTVNNEIAYEGGNRAPWVHLRLVYEAANTFRLSSSMDGITWIDMHGAITHSITPTHFGIMQTTHDSNTYPMTSRYSYFRVRSGLSANG